MIDQLVEWIRSEIAYIDYVNVAPDHWEPENDPDFVGFPENNFAGLVVEIGSNDNYLPQLKRLLDELESVDG